MNRRSFLSGSLSLAALPLARPAAAAESIRVGYLGPQTGIFAQAGKDMLDGLKLAFEQVNYQAGGRKVELIEEDTEGNPATAQAKYRKLVQQDKIHVLTGVLLSNIGYALVQPIERDTLPALFLTTPDDLTKRKLTKWILRTNFSASQPMHALGDYAAKTLKYRRVAVVAMDNPFGHQCRRRVQRRPLDHRGGERARGPGRRPRTLPGRDPPGERDHSRSAGAHHARRVRQSHAERLHPEGRARRWKASEHRDPHLPDGVAVLDVQARRVPQVAGLRPQLPSGKTMRTMEQRRHCMKRTTPVTPSTATVAPWGMRRVA